MSKLQARSKAAATHDERTRWQALMLLSDPALPRPRGEVARIVQRSANWIGRTVQRYNVEGPDGPVDRRKGRSHPPAALNEDQRQALEVRLQTLPDDGGRWTARQVASWIEAVSGRPVSVVTGWSYLRRLGYTVQRPRPQHPQAASPPAQERHKKNSGR